MLNRSMSNKSDFSNWYDQQKVAQNPVSNGENVSFLGQMSSIQDNFTNQLQELSGALPEAGVLSSSFRERVTNSIYLLAASVLFAFLTIFLGLPTMLIRPSKFVVCLSLSTLFAALSVVVMQKPSVFLANVVAGGMTTILPIVLLFVSTLVTLYITVFVPRYLWIVVAGGIQLVCLLFYMASFIPGGTNGLIVLLRTMVMVMTALLTPFYYVAKKGVQACVSRYTSS